MYANYVGDASFALTGTVAAGVEGLDLVGCVVVGFITALGGGTFRDVMLGRTPIFWLAACRATKGCFNLTSTRVIGDDMCQRLHADFRDLVAR